MQVAGGRSTCPGGTGKGAREELPPAMVHCPPYRAGEGGACWWRASPFPGLEALQEGAAPDSVAGKAGELDCFSEANLVLPIQHHVEAG